MELRRNETALMVVDMQNGFCREAGSINGIGLPAARLQPAIEPCCRLVAAARVAQVPVIFTRYVYRPDYIDGGVMVRELIPDLQRGNCLRAGSHDADIIEELAPETSDYVVDKNRPSAFYATGLEPVLTGLGVTDLVVCGVTTNCCVETTVRDASQRDYRVFVVGDAVAEYEQDRHDVALRSMGMLFARVVNVEEVLAAWAAT